MSVRVKICGITHPADAEQAVEAGADALGFVFCEGSVRRVSSAVAREIIATLPPFVAKVGLFVNPDEDEVRRTMEITGIDTLQFHGNESPDFCRKFPLKLIKAFRVRDQASLEQLLGYPGTTWLLDSAAAGKLGGTGTVCDWSLAEQANKLGGCLILAGGLNPGNVAAAVRQVQPYAVDVSSGVEGAPGRKDRDKVRAFVEAAKEVGSERTLTARRR